MFMLRDVKSGGGGVFETCGLVTEKGRWEPKPSWFYVATLRSRLAGYAFDSEVRSMNPAVRIYRFANASTRRIAYAVWCATSEDRRVAGCRLDSAVDSTVVELTDGSTTGRAREVKASAGSLALRVSETPILVFPDAAR